VNGAESLLAALTRNGIDVCFANPGTSELHFVAALDRTEGMRCVLGLILRSEMSNVGVTPGGPKAEALTGIGSPRIDWLSLARAFGAEAFRAATADELSRHIDAGLAIQGPVVIEVVL